MDQNTLLNPGPQIPQTRQLQLKFFHYRYIVTPFGLLCGIKDDKPRAAPENKVLEESYRKKKNPNDIEIGVCNILIIYRDQQHSL